MRVQTTATTVTVVATATLLNSLERLTRVLFHGQQLHESNLQDNSGVVSTFHGYF